MCWERVKCYSRECKLLLSCWLVTWLYTLVYFYLHLQFETVWGIRIFRLKHELFCQLKCYFLHILGNFSLVLYLDKVNEEHVIFISFFERSLSVFTAWGYRWKVPFILHCNRVALYIDYYLLQLNTTHCTSCSLRCNVAMQQSEQSHKFEHCNPPELRCSGVWTKLYLSCMLSERKWL